jgi:hypothetical protein
VSQDEYFLNVLKSEQYLRMSADGYRNIWLSFCEDKKFCSLLCSVADPECLSRIPDPDFYPSRIPDPKTATKDRGEKKFDVILFM